MQHNSLVSIKTYFDFPFRKAKSRHHSNKCSIQEKYNYIVELKNWIFMPRFNHTAIVKFNNTELARAIEFLKKCTTYEMFRLLLPIERDNSAIITLAALMIKGYFKWIVQFYKDDPKLLNRFAEDKDFSKLVKYILDCDLYSETSGLF